MLWHAWHESCDERLPAAGDPRVHVSAAVGGDVDPALLRRGSSLCVFAGPTLASNERTLRRTRVSGGQEVFGASCAIRALAQPEACCGGPAYSARALSTCTCNAAFELVTPVMTTRKPTESAASTLTCGLSLPELARECPVVERSFGCWAGSGGVGDR